MSDRHEVTVWLAPARGCYRAQCVCGWRGGTRSGPELARLTGVDHVRASDRSLVGALPKSEIPVAGCAVRDKT